MANTYGTGIDLHQAQAIAQLPADLMLLKMENESIMSVARAAPRDPVKIVGQLQDLIDAYPAAADDAIYSKPVGTVVQVTCGACGVRYEVNKIEQGTHCPACESEKYGPSRKIKKYAEGLSIRAAESIRSIYGYTRLATSVQILDDGKAKLTGVLVDYAAGNLTSDERIVSPMYRGRGGRMEQTPEDRFLNVVVKAEKAKLRRDIILDNTPNIVKAMFRDACEKKLKDLVAPEVVEQKIIPAFREFGVTVEHLEKIVGRSRKLGWRENERLELRKILTALKSEETTVRELLEGMDIGPSTNGGLPAQADKPAAKASGAVTGEHLLNPKGGAGVRKESPASKPAPAKPPETPPEESFEQDEPEAEQAADDSPAADTTEESQAAGGADGEGEMAEWYVRLQEDLAGCDGIRGADAVGDKYFGKNPQYRLTADEQRLAASIVKQFNEKIRASRGPRSNAQPEMFGNES